MKIPNQPTFRHIVTNQVILSKGWIESSVLVRLLNNAVWVLLIGKFGIMVEHIYIWKFLESVYSPINPRRLEMKRNILQAAIMVFVLVLFFGCSGGRNNSAIESPVATDLNGIPMSDDNGNACLWGMWQIEFDTENLTASIEPMRDSFVQYNVTPYIPKPEIKIISFSPITRIMDVEVKIKNSYSISGYDVRGILYTNNNGLMVTNADDWTAYFDRPGGQPINPFKAFAKSEVNRKFAGLSNHTERYSVYLPNPPGSVVYAVTASFPSNCDEPYSIDNLTQSELFDSVGSTAWVQVDVLDWQNDVNHVFLSASAITGQPLLSLNYQGGNTWGNSIINSAGASAGTYQCIIVAGSANSGMVFLYDVAKIVVSHEEIPNNPIDITPEYLNFSPLDVDVEGNYAYVAADYNGLHIFDITDPEHPQWISRVPLPNETTSVDVVNGYAYVGGGGLLIIDVDPPETAYVVNTVPLGLYNINDVVVLNGYAYVAEGSDGFYIVDVDPVEDASMVSTIDTPGIAYGVDFENSYAYVADGSEGLHIILATPPESPSIVNTVPISGPIGAIDVDCAKGYAYVANYDLQIVDVNPPESASVVKSVETPGFSQAVVYQGGYVYCADDKYGISVVDVEPINTASVVSSVDTNGVAWELAVSGGSAFLACQAGGLNVIDVSIPESAKFLAAMSTPGYARGSAVGNGYAFVANQYGGFQVIDVDPPDHANVILELASEGDASAVALSGSYAFMAESYMGLGIINIDPPESASYVNSVGTFNAQDVSVVGDYAYVADYDAGLQIIDINPVDSAYIVQTVDTPGLALGVAAYGGYAYVADHAGGLQVVDVDPPESASIVQNVPIDYNSWDVALQGNYAYVVSPHLNIVDISVPENASVVKIVSLTGGSYGVDVQGGYAYVANYGFGLATIDVYPIPDAYVLSYVTCPKGAFSVDVNEQYAYVSSYEGGLRIIQLW